ncbi:hypothetical protein [Agromyces humatus]|uniref:Uncharacterized protein n=1 Tax=Agromyces humatus TaxID=279573 RepID=A0ABN2KWF7_9MICO|nr:hypothetical protein [Agromyces humatus]
MEWLQRGSESVGITFGSWPDWIAAIATGLAFLIAAITYARSTRDHREGQARLVYATFKDVKSYPPGEVIPISTDGVDIGYGEGTAIVPGIGDDGKHGMVTTAGIMRTTVAIHNGSKELIGPLKLQLWDPGAKKLFDRVALTIGPIEPETDKLVDFSVINAHFPGGEPSLSPVIIFRDSSGRWWKRHQYEPIERIHDDPNNLAETPTERAERAIRVREWFGKELDPEPKPSLRVKYHRLMRRLRGKQPIP